MQRNSVISRACPCSDVGRHQGSGQRWYVELHLPALIAKGQAGQRRRRGGKLREQHLARQGERGSVTGAVEPPGGLVELEQAALMAAYARHGFQYTILGGHESHRTRGAESRDSISGQGGSLGDGVPRAIVRRELRLGRPWFSSTRCEHGAVDGYCHAGGRGGNRSLDKPLPPRDSRNLDGLLFHELPLELIVQLVHELCRGCGLLDSSRPKLDGGAHGLSFLRVRPKRLGPAVADKSLDKVGHL